MHEMLGRLAGFLHDTEIVSTMGHKTYLYAPCVFIVGETFNMYTILDLQHSCRTH